MSLQARWRTLKRKLSETIKQRDRVQQSLDEHLEKRTKVEKHLAFFEQASQLAPSLIMRDHVEDKKPFEEPSQAKSLGDSYPWKEPPLWTQGL